MTAPKIAFSTLLQDFFQRRLIDERAASAQTVSSYRDTFALLLRFAERRTRRPPSALMLEDLDAPMILAFLDHLEKARGNSPRTRNLRLTTVRSFMRYASIRDPFRFLSHNASWRFPPSASTGQSSASSRARRSKHFSMRLTGQRSAGSAMRCSSRRSTTPAHASPK
jgi:integrase